MTTIITITPNLDDAPWADVLQAAQAAGKLASGSVDRIGLLPGGTSNGRASVAVLVTTTDGRTVVAETTLDAFAAAVRGLLAAPLAEAEGHAR